MSDSAFRFLLPVVIGGFFAWLLHSGGVKPLATFAAVMMYGFIVMELAAIGKTLKEIKEILEKKK